MKPLEPGCIAIIIIGKYAGTQVSVIDKAPLGEFTLPNGVRAVTKWGDEWILDLPFPLPCEYSDGEIKMVSMACVRSKYLMRIDDYDPSTEETKSDREVKT